MVFVIIKYLEWLIEYLFICNIVFIKDLPGRLKISEEIQRVLEDTSVIASAM